MNRSNGSNSRPEAVIYARVSSKEQEKEGYSIPAQLKLLNSYAIEQGYRIVHEFIDVETAKKTGRPGLNPNEKVLPRHQNNCSTHRVAKPLMRLAFLKPLIGALAAGSDRNQSSFACGLSRFLPGHPFKRLFELG